MGSPARKHFVIGGGATNIVFRGSDGRWKSITRGQAPKTLPDEFLASGRAQAMISAGQLIEVNPKQKKGEANSASPPPKKKAKK